MSENKPLKVLPDGPIRATIWKSEPEKRESYSTGITKFYRDKEGNWQDGKRFGEKDMLCVGEISREAHHVIKKDKRENAKVRARQPSPERR